MTNLLASKITDNITGKHVRRKSRKNNMKLSNGPDPGYYDKSKS